MAKTGPAKKSSAPVAVLIAGPNGAGKSTAAPRLLKGALGVVEFLPGEQGVTVRVTFDAESTHSVEQQRDGWQAILNKFTQHVQAA